MLAGATDPSPASVRRGRILGSSATEEERDVTDDKNFKRLVRARMAEAGESYTEARGALRGGAAARTARSSPTRCRVTPASS